jgi:hypothetical protein
VAADTQNKNFMILNKIEKVGGFLCKRMFALFPKSQTKLGGTTGEEKVTLTISKAPPHFRFRNGTQLGTPNELLKNSGGLVAQILAHFSGSGGVVAVGWEGQSFDISRENVPKVVKEACLRLSKASKPSLGVSRLPTEGAVGMFQYRLCSHTDETLCSSYDRIQFENEMSLHHSDPHHSGVEANGRWFDMTTNPTSYREAFPVDKEMNVYRWMLETRDSFETPQWILEFDDPHQPNKAVTSSDIHTIARMVYSHMPRSKTARLNFFFSPSHSRTADTPKVSVMSFDSQGNAKDPRPVQDYIFNGLGRLVDVSNATKAGAAFSSFWQTMDDSLVFSEKRVTGEDTTDTTHTATGTTHTATGTTHTATDANTTDTSTPHEKSGIIPPQENIHESQGLHEGAHGGAIPLQENVRINAPPPALEQPTTNIPADSADKVTTDRGAIKIDIRLDGDRGENMTVFEGMRASTSEPIESPHGSSKDVEAIVEKTLVSSVDHHTEDQHHHMGSHDHHHTDDDQDAATSLDRKLQGMYEQRDENSGGSESFNDSFESVDSSPKDRNPKGRKKRRTAIRRAITPKRLQDRMYYLETMLDHIEAHNANTTDESEHVPQNHIDDIMKKLSVVRENADNSMVGALVTQPRDVMDPNNEDESLTKPYKLVMGGEELVENAGKCGILDGKWDAFDERFVRHFAWGGIKDDAFMTTYWCTDSDLNANGGHKYATEKFINPFTVEVDIESHIAKNKFPSRTWAYTYYFPSNVRPLHPNHDHPLAYINLSERVLKAYVKRLQQKRHQNGGVLKNPVESAALDAYTQHALLNNFTVKDCAVVNDDNTDTKETGVAEKTQAEMEPVSAVELVPDADDNNYVNNHYLYTDYQQTLDDWQRFLGLQEQKLLVLGA